MQTSYLTPTSNHFACDIEADNLLEEATTIWCCTVLNVVTKEEASFTTAEEFAAWRADNINAIFVGHNFLAYDAPMLNKHWQAKIKASNVCDTFVMSQLFNPSMSRPKGLHGKKGPHSLEAWGLRLNYPKGDFDDFSAYSETMLTYCRRDTRLTALLFLRLTERMRSIGFTEVGCELEHAAWNIIHNKQRRNGFPFDYKRAEELYVRLRAREKELQDEIYKLWPPRLEIVGTYRKPYNRDGEPSANYRRHCEQFPKVVVSDDTYTAYDFISFNLGSPAQRIEKLLQLGWKPVNFTKKTDKGGGGNPKVDEDELVAFAESSGNPEVALLAKWIVTNSRANMINTWLESYNADTKAIHGKLFIASTLRYRHSGPNSANISAVRLKKDANGNDQIQYTEDGAYTYESRDLWTTSDRKTRQLVGVDGAGIQNRGLIHNLIKVVGEERVREFKELALAGDVHKRNIEIMGVANKAAAKKAYFTMMMGGGGGRIAADQAQFGTKMTSKEGDALKKRVIASMPGFGELIKVLEQELEKTGRIKLCDGTPILVPSPHMVIPYLLQGDESRVMKKTMILIDEQIRSRRLDAKKVCDVHDEFVYDVLRRDLDEFSSILPDCFRLAGEFFNYNIPIECNILVGNTWSEVH